MKQILTKPEVRFWMGIIAVVVSCVWFMARAQWDYRELKVEVRAMNKLKEEYTQINERLIRMEQNQKHIMSELGIKID